MKNPARAPGLLPASLIALLLGSLHGLAFTAPDNAHWLGWTLQIGLVALALRLLTAPGCQAGLRRLWWLAWLFGTANFSVGLYWLYISMHDYGGMLAPIAAAAVVALGAYLAVFGAIAVTLGARFTPGFTAQSAPAIAPLALAACWGAMEILRGLLFTGFPWLAMGYAHVDGPLAGYAPLVGVYGMSALAVLIAALLAMAWLERRVAAALVAVTVLVGGLPLSRVEWTTAHGEASLPVRLLQGNVPQSLKFDPFTSAQAITDYIAMIAASPAPLVITPETAFTRALDSLPPSARHALQTALAASGATAALGMPLRSTEAQSERQPRASVTNSVLTINADGQVINRYDKRHLVPFGEFIPPGFGWFIDLMNIPLGEFGRGTLAQPLLEFKGLRLAFNICYEDLFGEELAHQVRDGAHVLINVTNLGWFGDSIALPQHLNISRVRSLELARPMLRATNTGVTAHIDHHGKVLAQLPAFEQSALDVQVEPRAGLTPYARYGLLAPLALITLLAAGAITMRRKARRDAVR